MLRQRPAYNLQNSPISAWNGGICDRYRSWRVIEWNRLKPGLPTIARRSPSRCVIPDDARSTAAMARLDCLMTTAGERQTPIVLGGSMLLRLRLFCKVRQHFPCIPVEHRMLKNWSGQVALVSGADSEHGIGLAIAKRLGDLGAKLIITGSSARISVVRSTHQLSTQSKWPRIRNGVSIPSTGFKQLVFQIRVALWKS
jgi:hypothetical protein